MSSLMLIIIAIILAGATTFATISYLDGAVSATTPVGVAVAASIQSGVEAAAAFQQARGVRPQSISDLREGGLEPLPSVIEGGRWEMRCAGSGCSALSLCVSVPDGEGMRAAMTVAADRLKGQVSGECGSADAAIIDRVVAGVTF